MASNQKFEFKLVDMQPLVVPLGQRLVQPIGSMQPISCYVPYGSQHSNTNTTVSVAGHYVDNMQIINDNFKQMIDLLNTLNKKIDIVDQRLTSLENRFDEVADCVYSSDAYYQHTR